MPKIVAFNKADVTENLERFETLRAALPDAFCISAAAVQGLQPLLESLYTTVARVKREEAEYIPMEDLHAYVYEAPFQIFREPTGEFRVEGERPLRVVRMTNFENEEAVRHLQKVLTRMGLLRALKRLGALPGHTVVIGDVEMEYQPEQFTVGG